MVGYIYIGTFGPIPRFTILRVGRYNPDAIWLHSRNATACRRESLISSLFFTSRKYSASSLETITLLPSGVSLVHSISSITSSTEALFLIKLRFALMPKYCAVFLGSTENTFLWSLATANNMASRTLSSTLIPRKPWDLGFRWLWVSMMVISARGSSSRHDFT